MMSGTIAIQNDRRWSAASWVFDWVVNLLADRIDDQDLVQTLHEVIEENLGWVDLESLPREWQRQIIEIIRDELVPASEGRLPRSLPNRDEIMNHLRSLAEMARAMPR
jgi:hypothetical protein